MQILFNDLKPFYRENKSIIDDMWLSFNERCQFILGQELSSFENEFANYIGVKSAVGVGNGLDALTLSLRALDIGANDSVIVPAFTFIATWLAVSQVGAIPIGVDVSSQSYNMDPDLIEEAITENTKAIIPVHLFGRIAPMDRINAIAKKYNLYVIEDSAQSHGAKLNGRQAGSYGDISAFSFYPGKNLGAMGDGGAIVSDDHSLSDKIKLLRNYGSKERYFHEAQGVNSRLDEIQAGILRLKLVRLDTYNQRRRVIAKKYLDGLAGLSYKIALPQLPENEEEHVWHLFTLRSKNRENLRNYLASKGIETLIHYPKPPHLQEAYKYLEISANFPITESISNEIFSIPMHPYLEDKEIDYVVEQIKSYFK